LKLAQIRMKLGIPDGQEFSFYKSSMFQGVLMEWISTEYAEKLHTGGWNPYAQYIKKIQNEWYWIVSIFNEEAYQEIVPVILSEEKNEIELKRDHLTIPIIEKMIEEIDTNDLLNQFYFKDAPRTIRIRFITPTAFKQNGQYLFMPDIGCILQSMIHKYDAVTTNTGNIDEKILSELKQNLRIQQYNLRS